MDLQGIGMLKSRMQETIFMSQNQETLNEESISLANALSSFSWPHFKVQEPCTLCCGRTTCTCCEENKGSIEQARIDDGIERVKELRKMRRQEEMEVIVSGLPPLPPLPLPKADVSSASSAEKRRSDSTVGD